MPVVTSKLKASAALEEVTSARQVDEGSLPAPASSSPDAAPLKKRKRVRDGPFMITTVPL